MGEEHADGVDDDEQQRRRIRRLAAATIPTTAKAGFLGCRRGSGWTTNSRLIRRRRYANVHVIIATYPMIS